ncbi:MAG: hypothetical protein WBN83_12540 [Desulfoprunum sp.]|uniref:hypothetical protein n=1 Tax=Desulfoprunum sp. TaxID=2020866 RepID=UPI003C765EC6
MKLRSHISTKLIKEYFLFGWMVAIFLAAALPDASLAASHDKIERSPLVSGVFKNIPMKDAIVSIEKNIGYKIILQSFDLSIPVSGEFVEKDINAVFTSLLKRYNLVVLIDNEKRIVQIKSLGKKGKNHELVNETVDATAFPENDGVESSEITNPQKEQGGEPIILEDGADIADRDPFTGKTEDEIIKLHGDQNLEIEQEVANPNTIEPFTGMTNAEIADLHHKQNENISGDQP